MARTAGRGAAGTNPRGQQAGSFPPRHARATGAAALRRRLPVEARSVEASVLFVVFVVIVVETWAEGSA